jgi:hypothetical protein
MGYTFTNTAASTVAVTNRFVVSVNMANGGYTVANASPAWSGGCLVTATITGVAGNDTPGTATIVGTGVNGQPLTEVLTLVAGGLATSTNVFRTVTSITQAGWVAVSTADTIVFGCAAGNVACGSAGNLGGVLINNLVATAATISDATRTIMTIPASAAAGTYYSFGNQGVDFGGRLIVSTTSTNDITVFHTSTSPASYSL